MIVETFLKSDKEGSIEEKSIEEKSIWQRIDRSTGVVDWITGHWCRCLERFWRIRYRTDERSLVNGRWSSCAGSVNRYLVETGRYHWFLTIWQLTKLIDRESNWSIEQRNWTIERATSSSDRATEARKSEQRG